MQYDWPGNVRELTNVLERVMSSIEHDTIHVNDLPTYIINKRKRFPTPNKFLLKKTLEDTEKDNILHALESNGYNKVRAAKSLGIHRSVLYKKIKKYNISLNRVSQS